MKPKKGMICILSGAIALASLLSCAKNTEKQTHTQTPEPVLSGTVNTSEPPEETPKPDRFPSRPTAPQDFSSEFSGLFTGERLGNLTGGELFGDPAKYFVLQGEGDLHYIYDRYGELMKVVPIESDYSSWGERCGFYGENGMLGSFSLKIMADASDYVLFGDMFLHIVDGELIEVLDSRFENPIPIKDRGLSLGTHGACLPFDGKILLIEAYHDSKTDTMEYGRCVWLDKSGEIAGEFDPSPFGIIRGAFKEKYIISRMGGDHMYHSSDMIFDVSGTLLVQWMDAVDYYDFSMQKDGTGSYMLSEILYKGSENKLFTLNDYADLIETTHAEYPMYYDITAQFLMLPLPENREIVISPANGTKLSVYAGLKDLDGNWLFKIYNPALASDSRRKSMWG